MMKIVAAVVVGVVLLVGAQSVSSSLSHHQQNSGSQTAGSETTSKSSPSMKTIVASGCLDETGSTAKAFHESILKAVIAELRGWYPADAPEGGADLTPELELALFPVTQASTNYGVQPFRAHLPGLAGLPKLPTADDGDVSDWLIGKQTWTEQRQKNVALARQAAQDLIDYRFALPDSSGVGTCLSAVALDLGGQSQARIGFFSDLANTSKVQTAGNLRSALVSVTQPCNRSVAECRHDYDTFAELAKRMGAASVSAANPKNPDQAVRAWLGH